LSIQLIARITAHLALAGSLTLACFAQQTAPSGGSDAQSPAQPATQPSAQPQEAAKTPEAAAQQPPSNKDKENGENPSENGKGKVEGTSNDRLFYTLPNFLTLQGKRLPPMKASDKFKAVAVGSFDFVEFPWWGVLAALSQAENGEPAFRQGFSGYAKRYGTTAGDSLVENFMVGAVFPSVLHQDPRYYQSGQGGGFRRTGYAISRIFITYSDSGHKQFNFSEIFGAGTAAAISTYTYHPKSTYVSTPTNPHMFISSDRTFTNVVDVWGTQLGLDTITLVIKEFWPDIHRKISHKYRTQQESASNGRQ
jgi:hypothetical protein